jgi:hypothetical protein
MYKGIAVVLLCALTLTACGPTAAGQERKRSTEEQVMAVAVEVGLTVAAFTERAAWTDTPTPSDTPTPTDTPTETPTPTFTLTPSPTATITPTVVYIPPTATASPERDKDKAARLRFDVQEGTNILVVLTTDHEETYRFSTSWNLEVDVEPVSYQVWVDGNGPFTGKIKIANTDKHTMVIYKDKVVILYP